MNTEQLTKCGMPHKYVPPCTIWIRLDMEDGIMAASKDPVIDDNTAVTIDRQSGANADAWNGNNIVGNVTDDYKVDWE